MRLAFDAETKMMARPIFATAISSSPSRARPRRSILRLGVDADGRGDLSAEERRRGSPTPSARRGWFPGLALAEKTVPVTAEPTYDALNFLGLVGFRDPPRAEVKAAMPPAGKPASAW